MQERGASTMGEASVPLLAEEVEVEVIAPHDVDNYALDDLPIPARLEGPAQVTLEARGVTEAEGAKAVFGKYGRYLLWASLSLVMIVYEFDNSTVYVYQSYAPSTYDALSNKAALSTAAIIVAAVTKPPIAKISDVIGRASTYSFTISCYVLSYILCSGSSNFATYAVGVVVYSIGQAGTNILNDLIISDNTTARWRTFGLAVSFSPFLVMPWVSAVISDSVVNGIGWRWGIGMLGFILPPSASLLVITLWYYQRKAKRLGIIKTKKITTLEFFSSIDAGGLSILWVGSAMLLLPISLAATAPKAWHTGWIIALLILGLAFLLILVPYEAYVSKHPMMPPRYFRNLSIVLVIKIGFLDELAFSASHQYLYSWAVVAHNYSVRKATFYTYINGVVQCLVAMIAGLIISRSRSYKWTVVVACLVRTVGFGLMVHLRGANNSDAELFIVQAIQGIGSGVIQIVCLTIAQVVVPHAEMAQVSALVMLAICLGSGLGSTTAGGIYTNNFKEALRNRMGDKASPQTIEAIYNSILASDLPAWGTAERTATNLAYSDIMRYISITALAISAPVIVFALLLPNLRLSDKQNIVETKRSDPDVGMER
ncbi:hypothetical protein AAFC00_006522 [Neodothiora populina]|uniref:Siderochrome-iron transporter n=1 Tax=Neodothiora populina TaxID=2781224 RepID=A0ABR3PA75_9PEZI